MSSHLTQYLMVLGLGIQLGTVVFFSFVLTPVLFGHLTREEAGRAVRLTFPGYYFTGIAALTLSLSAALASGRSMVLLGLLGAALAVDLYAALSLLPRQQRLRETILDPEARDETDPAQAEWNRLHALSVQLNGAALLLGLATLWLAVR